MAATSARTRAAGTTAPGWPCYRAGGNICYADTPQALNREHAIFDADRCVAVNPSDTAPALIALGAQMVIRGPGGERVVEAEDYFIGPGTDITRMTVLAAGELLTAIRIPGTFAGARFYFEKVADRNVWDFPLVNVASAMRTERRDGAGDPHRRQRRGRAAAPAGRRRAGRAGPRARRGDGRRLPATPPSRAREPLQHNGYKVPLLRNLVRRAIRGSEDS